MNKYDDLFNSWDGSALDRKELNPELADYLERASWELPIKNKVELCFYMPEEEKNIKKEKDSRATIKNNFRMDLHLINRDLKINNKKSLIYIFMGLIFLFPTLILKNSDFNLWLDMLMQGVFVGGWVFLWEAFSLFFFVSHDLRDKKKRYLRYLDSDIKFKYY
ncbi:MULTISPECIES: hypothetical protein [unclassified Halanaerobium]|uniref:hypothetical protein n=1 Tax=unclassified Halanaerobium TaxID=2641197 RepID=UPI000E1B2C4C|nr:MULTISPECIES: hypothetical protein [unclassified Halanaerobium]RCW41699.1 hypothetical protein DFR78_13119 [Halanaerobium sp. MA284_MarDTE_T2]RCW79484.1 hypothetical protein DER71_13813 [Halanaerobium sp. DL-01]